MHIPTRKPQEIKERNGEMMRLKLPGKIAEVANCQRKRGRTYRTDVELKWRPLLSFGG